MNNLNNLTGDEAYGIDSMMSSRSNNQELREISASRESSASSTTNMSGISGVSSWSFLRSSPSWSSGISDIGESVENINNNNNNNLNGMNYLSMINIKLRHLNHIANITKNSIVSAHQQQLGKLLQRLEQTIAESNQSKNEVKNKITQLGHQSQLTLTVTASQSPPPQTTQWMTIAMESMQIMNDRLMWVDKLYQNRQSIIYQYHFQTMNALSSIIAQKLQLFERIIDKLRAKYVLCEVKLVD